MLLLFDRFLDLLRLAVKKQMAAAGKVARASFKLWLDAAMLKGARRAHGLLRAKAGETIQVTLLVVRGVGHPSLEEAMEVRAQSFEAKWTRTANASRAKLRVIDLIRRARRSEKVEIGIDKFVAGFTKVSNSWGWARTPWRLRC